MGQGVRQEIARLVSYINSSLDYREIGWIGVTANGLDFKVYADADFAGDGKTFKSTNGCASMVDGSYSNFFISANSQHK